MMKILEAVGIVGGILVIIAFVLIVGFFALYLYATANGKNPFQ